MTTEQEGLTTIVVGGQYGSEGKGAITHHVAMNGAYDMAIRGGSENAGHTIWHQNQEYKNQVVPVAWPDAECELGMAAGSSFSIGQFQKEIQWMKDHDLFTEGRVVIDKNAGIISDQHVNAEAVRQIGNKIGSTAHGCGAALIDKLWRDGFKTAKDYPELAPYVGDVSREANRVLDGGGTVLLEGTQGTLLSVDHTPHYPYCTSRNATASAIAAEAGIGPRRIGEVIMVVRSYPIRVGGNSGPTGAPEITWEDVTDRSGAVDTISERTTVTNKLRRVFEFSEDDFLKSLELNDPTQIAVTFADYWDALDYGKTRFTHLSPKTRQHIRELEGLAGVPVTIIKTGPKPEHVIDLRKEG